MPVQTHFSLRSYNTFGIDVYAEHFAEFHNTGELLALIKEHPAQSVLVLGGGSNILFLGDVKGLVLANRITGIEKIGEDEQHVYVKAGAGENWHRFVLHCIDQNWAGVENLSLIPGCVGASPMQNIGAYGVEIKDVFQELSAVHLQDGVSRIFTREECGFGYRESVFKNKYKGQYVITDVTFRLSKQPHFNTSYGAIEEELQKMGIRELSIRAISQAVINIRSSKLPDPAVTGNAGSFFKNPSVPVEQYHELKKTYPTLVGYPNADGSMKLAAGWLIEHCGPDSVISWKGFRTGDAGVHPRQALVLVNYGNASGRDIYHLSERILASVKEKYGVELEREVNMAGRI